MKYFASHCCIYLFSVWFVLENMRSGKWLGPTFFPLHRKAKLLSMQQMWHGLWLTSLTAVSPSATRGMWTICLPINLFADISLIFELISSHYSLLNRIKLQNRIEVLIVQKHIEGKKFVIRKFFVCIYDDLYNRV